MKPETDLPEEHEEYDRVKADVVKHKIKSKKDDGNSETDSLHDMDMAEEKSYVCVHAKKGKHECKATSPLWCG